MNLILSTLFREEKVVLLSADYTDVIFKVQKYIFVRDSACPVLAYIFFFLLLFGTVNSPPRISLISFSQQNNEQVSHYQWGAFN